MSDYTFSNNFTAKDALPTGNPSKLIVGADFDTEFNAIETAVNSKYDAADLASQAEAQAGTLNTKLMTPLRTEEWSATWAAENAGIVGDLQALASPGADRILFWDNGAGAATFLTVSTGLTLSGTNLTTNDSAINHDSLSGFVANEHINHTSVTLSAGLGITGGGDISTNRSFTFAPSELSTIGGNSLSYTADSIVIDDGGTPKRVTLNDASPKCTSTSAAKTFADGDQNQTFVLTGATGRTFTINSTFNSACEIGTVITLINADTGEITVAGSGITLTSKNSNVKVSGQGGAATVIKIAASEWMLFGDLA